ncbi:PGG domain containing protein [Parasponia andersonii]|uniref:PGG domain containing protein n=1 Tax=Parasponia andersonii TaxID=3476 RepID=A0A2P5DCY3_PARAD|nr:PGG domain containing protein [Parasponia andersonii]
MALDLIKRCPRLAVATGAYIVPSLVVIAMCKSAFPSGSPLAFWQNWIYKCIQIPTSSTNDTCIQISGDSTTTSEDTLVYTRGELDKEPDERIKKATTIVSGVLRGIGSYLFEFLGIKKIYELKLIHVQSQELLRCILGNLKTFMSEDRRLVTDVAHQAMFQAVEEGNVEFVIEISRTIPELIRHVDHRQRSVFSYAVECRQAEIFSLVHGFVILKEEIAAITDDYGNTVLHMAGKLAPSSHLSRISGAALQMQRELQWFKEVESIMQNKLINKEYYLNGKGMTPREFFTENHKELAKDGEKWMKETAANCTFVAALIVTIMFAAAFMVPGGNDQENKLTTISHEKWFLLFIISDAISLFSSTTSVLMFLGILTSRYYEDAFLRSLPTKLIIGLSTLFFSIATMMISFCSALYVMMQGQQCILIPVILLASVPVTLFVSLQFPLLVEIFVSTFGSGMFTRKYENWLLQ